MPDPLRLDRIAGGEDNGHTLPDRQITDALMELPTSSQTQLLGRAARPNSLAGSSPEGFENSVARRMISCSAVIAPPMCLLADPASQSDTSKSRPRRDVRVTPLQRGDPGLTVDHVTTSIERYWTSRDILGS